MREVNARSVEADLVDDLFPSRWSARAFSGERISDDVFSALIEAARWTPSSSNNQPWRFIAAARGSPAWSSFLAVLHEGNREWAHTASHLIILVGKETTERGTPYAASAFDCGAAWMSLALQAELLDLSAHAMGGFDKEAARATARIPEGFAIHVMIAVGPHGSPDELPEHRRASEHARSLRKPKEAIASDDAFAPEWN